MDQQTKAAERLTFSEPEHRYELDGKYIPSVTTILDDVGLKTFPDFVQDREWYADRGTKVHKACHLFDIGKLVPESVDPAITGYLKAYELAKKEMGFTVVHSELRVFDEAFWVAGTLDKFVAFRGGKTAIIDLKCGAKNRGDRYQTAGYGYAFGGYFEIDRLALYLRDDGSFAPDPHDDDSDFTVFQSACNVYHAKYR
ncbi:MAG: hypothetical protein GWM98_11665 [Nitrospinaceae bacterium]|nr:hypothetical protein [Nitrospinaceae bacterium]NIR55041.1 hypothetical protein [Nitrospinaceae bacterium]NIS85440.1 hypothetical protein [Nitrospinaceae bacterium]NIT82279.1 hypothetical protein [Nitrospinaceae bacterium]NIU44510.1 hypothetical protein [Nitrospinaceae bacterium]